MSLFFSTHIDAHTRLGIWKMDETEEELHATHPFLCRYDDELNTRFHNKTRRIEFLSVRALTAVLLNDTTSCISYADDGKPLLSTGKFISISHTKEFAAVIISETAQVAVDIERKGRNLQRIKAHFMRDDEQAESDDELLIHWCVKETLYKLFSQDHLMTNEIQVVSTIDNHSKHWQAINLKQNIIIDLHVIDFHSFIVTFAMNELKENYQDLVIP